MYRPKRLLPLLLTVLLLLSAVPVRAAEALAPSAAAAIVMDCQTGQVYFEKNADEARPVASMTKVLTLYLVFEALERGDISLDDAVSLSQRAHDLSWDPEYSAYERFPQGISISVDTLIGLTVITSSCASAIALAEYVAGSEADFVERMNQTVKDWGLNAHFADAAGLVDEGNAVTARAMAEIVRRTLTDHPELLLWSSRPSLTYRDHTYKNTNLLISGETPMEGVDGLKTGYTDAAGRCLAATARREGQRILSIAMGYKDQKTCAAESRALLEHGFDRLKALRTAYPNTGAIWVDGKKVQLAMYALRDERNNDTNYVRLRDLALILNGTNAQFSVDWSKATKTTALTSGRAYAVTGAELVTPFHGDQLSSPCSGTTMVNGLPMELDSFTLHNGGYTYVKLRDVGRALGFNVYWELWEKREERVCIDTTHPYTGVK